MHLGTFRLASRILPLIAAALVLPATLNARTYRTISHFDYFVNGGNIEHGVTLDAAGNLYGTTQNGGPLDYGVVFKLTKQPDGTWAESVLHFFQGGSGGRGPVSGVTFDENGNLYGVTVAGGVSCAGRTAGCGTAYKLTPQPDGSWNHSVIYAFSGTEGDIRGTELLFDTAGNLYGFGSVGNTNCCGVVFRLKPNSDGSWSEEILYAFKGGRDGNFPVGNLVFDKAGNLYGETAQGGNKDCGTVFKLTPNPSGSWSETVVHSFCASKSDGWAPNGGLTMDAYGNLFGVTVWGGGAAMPPCPTPQTGCGTVFRLKPQPDGGWSYRKIHTFLDTPSADPNGGLAVDAAGNLYGTTGLNGTRDYGTVFMLVHQPNDSWTEKTLHVFKGYPGIYPLGTLVLDKSGTLYGTTLFSNPFPGTGVVFMMIP